MSLDHLDREQGLSLLKEMMRIRRFESRAAQHYSEGQIRGFLHLYDGEEAVAVGIMRALNPDDAISVGVTPGSTVSVNGIEMTVAHDDSLPSGTVYAPFNHPDGVKLGTDPVVRLKAVKA